MLLLVQSWSVVQQSTSDVCRPRSADPHVRHIFGPLIVLKIKKHEKVLQKRWRPDKEPIREPKTESLEAFLTKGLSSPVLRGRIQQSFLSPVPRGGRQPLTGI